MKRHIIYECKCGSRKAEKVTVSFGEPFPIETTIGMTDSEFLKILNNE